MGVSSKAEIMQVSELFVPKIFRDCFMRHRQTLGHGLKARRRNLLQGSQDSILQLLKFIFPAISYLENHQMAKILDSR